MPRKITKVVAAIRKHRRGGPSEKVIEKQRKLKEEDDYHLNKMKQAKWPNFSDKLPRKQKQDQKTIQDLQSQVRMPQQN